MKKLLSVALACCASVGLFSGTANAVPSNWFNIASMVVVASDGSAWVWVTNGTVNNTTCTDKTGFRVTNVNLVRFLQGAQLAGKRVRVENSNTCVSNLDVVTSAQVES